MKLIRTGLISALLFSLPISVFAAPLSDEDKAAKRDELNQFFSTALVQTQPGELPPTTAKNQLRYTATGSVRSGYDSNVDLDQRDKGDGYVAERVRGLVEYDPEGVELFGQPVTLGTSAHYLHLGYFDRDDMEYQSGTIAPFARVRFGPKVALKGAYEFRGLHYDKQEDFNYFSNAGSLTLSHQITTLLSHKLTARSERLEFSERKQLLSNAVFGSGDREDHRHEAVYSVRNRMGRLLLDLDGVRIWNDSNDQFFDYNDYNEYGLDGSASLRVASHWIFTALGGYRHREYEERTLAVTTLDKQQDDWYLVGGRVFYAINNWSGVDISYNWRYNDSNDPTHHYTATNASVGYHLYF